MLASLQWRHQNERNDDQESAFQLLFTIGQKESISYPFKFILGRLDDDLQQGLLCCKTEDGKELQRARETDRPENCLADEGVLVELVELHGGQGRDHVHEVPGDYLHLRHLHRRSSSIPRALHDGRRNRNWSPPWIGAPKGLAIPALPKPLAPALSSDRFRQ